MTEQAYEARRTDALALLGAASHIIRRMAEGRALNPHLTRMAEEWTAGYDRYSRNERAAVSWLRDTHTAVEG